MKYWIYGLGMIFPFMMFVMGIMYSSIVDLEKESKVDALLEQVKVLEEESNDRYTTVIQLSDAINILGNHYNNTSGNKMVPVTIDGEKRLIIK